MRNEYPRMDHKRDRYDILNGEWNFKFDRNDEGLYLKWYDEFPQDSQTIVVPYAYQTKLSGINNQERCDIVWYQKTTTIKSGHSELHFGAIDYEADVYIDGQHMVNHLGGETAFSIDLFYEYETEISISVRVYDPSFDEEIPRGKQFWEKDSRSIWYTPTTGIWQAVWIDYVGYSKIINVKTNSNLKAGLQAIDIHSSKNSIGKKMCLQVTFEGEEVYEATQRIYTEYSHFEIEVYNNMIFKTPFHSGGKESICWSPEYPRLFDYEVTIVDENNNQIDKLVSYFGFREIKIENGMTYLNNNPYYFKLILDQGYWEGGLLTAPTDEDYVKDIQLSKSMGFNGCRKHQKVEDPRFLYWADKLGFLVWGEVASTPVFTEKTVKRMQNQWFDIINRDYNHPSIVAWVPLNESWGVPFIKFDKKQQAHSLSLYYQIKSVDDTRLVVNNDGWELTKTDICAIHNYNHGNENDIDTQEYFAKTMLTKEQLLSTRPSGKPIYANGFTHDDETPILITEFGGIAYDMVNPKGWGYTSVDNSQSLVSEYERIIDIFAKSEAIYGYCYTQLCDVEQEVNGLLTYNREPKCDVKEIKKINDRVDYRY